MKSLNNIHFQTPKKKEKKKKKNAIENSEKKFSSRKFSRKKEKEILFLFPQLKITDLQLIDFKLLMISTLTSSIVCATSFYLQNKGKRFKGKISLIFYFFAT